MKIASFYGKGRVVFSFEIFPPKKDSAIATVYDTLDRLADLKPDYMSVTYGAGASAANNSTVEIASAVKNKYGLEAVAHVTCVNCDKDDLLRIMEKLKEENVENILALRGDIPPDYSPKTDFRYASEMIAFIKAHGDFGISGGCYPECHYEAPDLVTDILNLKKKVDAGAEELVSQLFFDNRVFYEFRDKARLAGINVPIAAGIMPVTNKKQIERMVTLCGASVPQKLAKMLQQYEDKPEALIDAGIDYAAEQIADLIAGGAEGIHLYTMNNPYVARRISEIVGKL